MGKVIKVIDLLNMVAKGEDLPRIIKYRRKKYYLYTKPDNQKWYWKTDIEGNLGDDLFIDIYGLNGEVEILDEEDEIDIQKIPELMMAKSNGDYDEYSIGANRQIINNLVKAVKQQDLRLNKLESDT